MQQENNKPLHCTCLTLIKTSCELSLGVPSVPSCGRQFGDKASPSCNCLLAESQVSPSKVPMPLQKCNIYALQHSICQITQNTTFAEEETRPELSGYAKVLSSTMYGCASWNTTDLRCHSHLRSLSRYSMNSAIFTSEWCYIEWCYIDLRTALLLLSG